MKKTSLLNLCAVKYWPTWFGLAIMRVIAFLPLPVLALIGYVLGTLFYLLAFSRRAIAFKNIRSCFPEFSSTKCHWVNFQHFCLLGQSTLTVPFGWWVSKARLNRLITVKGQEHFDAALASKRPIIFLAPHFMSIEMGGLSLAQTRPAMAMYQYAKNTLVDEMVKRGRSRFGSILVERKDPLRKTIKLLREGYPLYYLPDQDAGRKGVFVPFFHEQAATVSMLGKFAQVSNSLVIPVRNHIKPWGLGYEVILDAPLENFPNGDEIIDSTTMNQAIEKMIRQAPQQYFWVHKRFKTRPETVSKFYN